MAEQEYVATRPFRAGGSDFVKDFERGEVVPLGKLADPHLLKETGDVMLSNSDEGLRAVADHEEYHAATEDFSEGTASSAGGAPDATQAAERRAEELSIDLRTVEGTGKDGRITVEDVGGGKSGENSGAEAPLAEES